MRHGFTITPDHRASKTGIDRTQSVTFLLDVQTFLRIRVENIHLEGRSAVIVRLGWTGGMSDSSSIRLSNFSSISVIVLRERNSQDRPENQILGLAPGRVTESILPSTTLVPAVLHSLRNLSPNGMLSPVLKNCEIAP